MLKNIENMKAAGGEKLRDQARADMAQRWHIA
jgi:hypothetical protein